ncbi:MAG TPA: S53 family peptidase [Candidatus Udaeobacter sp.]|nr:S53 family peptidase [Candidatus Udaeobacter sp.]
MDSSNAVVLSAKSNAVRFMGLGLFVVVLVGCLASQGVAATGRFIGHNTPNYVKTARNVGTEDPAKVIELSFWLNPRNRAGLDALASQLYDPTSPTFRHFLTRNQLANRFAPTAAQVKVLRQFLEANNLKVMRVGPMNFFVHVKGTVGDIETALHVQLNQYQVGTKVMRANDRDPYVDGAAAPLVRAIGGLDSGEYTHPMATRPTPPSSTPGKAFAATTAPAAPDSSFYSNNCFDGTETDVFSTNNDGEYPIGTYKGNHLNLQSLTSPGCGYTPPMIQAAYHLNALYAEGYDGTGQTIGIIDWCGSLTIQSDANAFSAQFGLPQLTSSNFAITYIPTVSTCQEMDAVEINIDVEWAHAIAPGANINLIVPPSASFADVDEAELTSVVYHLADTLSGSYGSIEYFTSTNELVTENLINQIAAIAGISANFSSGDQGDFTLFGIPASVSAPADSPYATAVGGVALALRANNSIAWQAGWGNNETLLAEEGFVFDPPLFFGFIGGAGGGMSNCVTYDPVTFACLTGFPKPAYQKKLPGKYRQLPDVSWLADPFTGAVIAISVPFQVPSLTWQVWGGTSVACPMFSALWAIANQEAGAPLGLAAPYLYSLPAGAVTDIVPITTTQNVIGSIQESATVRVPYNAAQMLGDSTSGKFVSAIWDYAPFQDTGLIISFGTDCSTEGPADFGTLCTNPTRLKTKVGWDNVTGVGTPNAKKFADAFHQ